MRLNYSNLIATCLGLAGFLIMAGCRLYHFSVHPEWSEAEVLVALWKFYGLSLCLVLFSAGWLWKSGE